MFSFRSKILIALDTATVHGARIAPSWRGREVRAVARRELASGALVPAALDTNVRRPEEVREVLRAVVSELGAAGRPAVVVLPDGVARTLIVDVPAGADLREYARFRLSSQLPYPAPEAIVEVAPAGKHRVLAAAIRRDIVVEYEKLVAAAGLTLDRLDLAPMAALAWLRRRRGAEPRVEVVLGEAVFSMALVGQGTTLAVRTRRRDPGPDEPERLALEVDRTAQLGAITPAGVRVVGPGAGRLAEAWTARGVLVEAGWGVVTRIDAREACELAWLGAAFD
jgi:Tfp pilus assembly PilM family ATPase